MPTTMTTNSSGEIRVKVLSRTSLALGGRRWSNTLCPGREPVWGPCRFVFDPFERDYDWLVVVDDMPRSCANVHGDPRVIDTPSCPRSRTLFVTTEPSSITRYGRHFVRQFAHLLTSQEEQVLPHPHAIRSQTGMPWFYGKPYDEIKLTPPIPKQRLLSTVCSSKRQGHTVHARRYAFTQRLSRELPGLDIYGHGVRFVERKADAIDPYAFHLAIENHYSPHHWSEKLADAFLGYAAPIYYGCPNVFDYFPRESLIPIDIEDFEGSLQTIKQALTYENYQRRLPAIQEARQRILDFYGLPALLSRTIVDLEKKGLPTEVNRSRILKRRVMRLRHPQDFIPFACWRVRNYVRGLWVNGGLRE